MESVQRRTIVIGPEGRVEVPTSELVSGTTAEILVLPRREKPQAPETLEGGEEHWATSDRLIAEGMETWDTDRIDEEIRVRRIGERDAL